MGSSAPARVPPSPQFLARFRVLAGSDGVMPFARFMELALYDPDLGYYRRDRDRVGYGRGTDFYTATTSGPIFGELVAAACVTLLGGRNPHDFTFVEIGAEAGGGVLREVAHPFGDVRTLRIGDRIEVSGNAVVFSNELFDAQPFRRLVFRNQSWRELAVAIDGQTLVETEVPPGDALPPDLPAHAPEGYVVDAPLAAVRLAEQIAQLPWRGLFVAFDYGKSWTELATATPAGTARAYFRHTQSNDLLNQPGEQDLTCHVCWDWLAEALRCNGFASPVVQSQEAFLIHHAGAAIAQITAAEASRLSPRKLSLMQLLHPSNLGQKFQVLHAARFESR